MGRPPSPPASVASWARLPAPMGSSPGGAICFCAGGTGCSHAEVMWRKDSSGRRAGGLPLRRPLAASWRWPGSLRVPSVPPHPSAISRADATPRGPQSAVSDQDSRQEREDHA